MAAKGVGLESDAPDQGGPWDDEADVLVVGFGAAGAAAAVEAADRGASVLVLERFLGGGATRLSGGIYYAGGGTAHQREAGFGDSPDNMFRYLQQETRGVVGDDTLRRFCDDAVANLEWLEANGVVFGSTYCPFKTSYPISKYTLYYSGNETFAPFTEHAQPAPRGHRPAGRGMGGPNIYFPLKASALRKGVKLQTQCQVQRLVSDGDGRVVGVEVNSLAGAGFWRGFHAAVSHLEYLLRYPTLAFPPLRHLTGLLYRLAERRGRRLRIRARKGVVLASGGFIYNRDMIRQEDPRYVVGRPLGCHGDDGSGIRMGQALGARTGSMDKVSVWRFINPPHSFTRGMLVSRQGQRLCNEMYYGAKIGEYMSTAENNTEAFLIIDTRLWKSSHRDCLPDQSNWAQALLALINLYGNWTRASTIEELAVKIGVNAVGLRESLREYNALADSGEDDPLGKPREAIQKLEPPYIAINCSLGAWMFPCASLTLGGLLVNEQTGEVKREDGGEIPGLYAAGRTAVGVCSSGYASGLAIADCVFSARRGVRHALEGE